MAARLLILNSYLVSKSVFKLKSSYLLTVFFCNWPKKGSIKIQDQCTLCLYVRKSRKMKLFEWFWIFQCDQIRLLHEAKRFCEHTWSRFLPSIALTLKLRRDEKRGKCTGCEPIGGQASGIEPSHWSKFHSHSHAAEKLAYHPPFTSLGWRAILISPN